MLDFRLAAAAAGFAAAAFAADAALAPATEPVVHVIASRFEFTPPILTLKRGQPAILEITSFDRLHGFKVPGLGLRIEALPDQAVRVRVTPEKTGRFAVLCDVFCGTGHDEMEAEILVVD